MVETANTQNKLAVRPRVSESQRLQTLRSYCVLDTPPEPAFDDLTELATNVFNVPIALVSLVDEHRQFFKSSVGLSLKETPRDISFCAYTILHEESMVVLDARSDERFKENPFVTGDPHIEFYAGAPLIDRNGVALGSFCIIDHTPRESFGPDEQKKLQRFADLTSLLIEQRLYSTRVRRAEAELAIMNERYRLATQATTEGIWEWNCHTDELFKSGRMRAIVGLESVDSNVQLEEWFRRVHPLDAPTVRANAGALATAQVNSYQLEYRVRHEDGRWRWVQSRAVAVRDSDGTLLRVVGSLADITADKMTDPLTGEHTRASLVESLDRRFRGTHGGRGHFAVLVLHFNAFKRISSSLGSSDGDVLMVGLASRIRQTLSTELADSVARLSSDEFAILLDYVAEEVDAVMYAGLLQSLLQVPFEIQDQKVSLTANIGIAVSSPLTLSSEDILHQAQTAAHEDRDIDGRCTVYSESLRESAARRMMLTSELRLAIETEALEMHYQPKVDLLAGTVIGFEALCRWPHPKLGNVPPDEFIPIAEEGDLIWELGRWALRESVRQLSDWRSKGIVPASAVMAVNLSARQFTDAQLVDTVKRKLDLYKLPPSCLALEVTEGILIQDVENATQILRGLKTLGIGLDLDDFGTGYSSLGYLQGFPFDALKVDRSFVRQMETDPGRVKLVSSIIAMAHAMNLRVVAEGIETNEQLRLLCEMECDCGQGYLFSRPVPAAQIPEFLRDWQDLPGRKPANSCDAAKISSPHELRAVA